MDGKEFTKLSSKTEINKEFYQKNGMWSNLVMLMKTSKIYRSGKEQQMIRIGMIKQK